MKGSVGFLPEVKPRGIHLEFSMKHAGELSGQLITSGTQIDREDCIIAATALQENEPVLTRNAAHFERVPNLKVETY